METVTSFKYMGRVMKEGQNDWPAVAGNLRKARKIWMQMVRILIREGADPKVLGLLFKAVVQAVLLFGLEMWVLTPRMERSLSRFQHRVAQRLTRRHPRRIKEGRWEYPPMAEAMEESGSEGIGFYITRRQKTGAQYFWTSVKDMFRGQ